MTVWAWLCMGIVWVLSWCHGWYVGRRAGFGEVLDDFAQLDMELEEITRRAAERLRDA